MRSGEYHTKHAFSTGAMLMHACIMQSNPLALSRGIKLSTKKNYVVIEFGYVIYFLSNIFMESPHIP